MTCKEIYESHLKFPAKLFFKGPVKTLQMSLYLFQFVQLTNLTIFLNSINLLGWYVFWDSCRNTYALRGLHITNFLDNQMRSLPIIDALNTKEIIKWSTEIYHKAGLQRPVSLAEHFKNFTLAYTVTLWSCRQN